jgi:DNA-binding XRE family transcriptional regulator
VYNIAVNKSAQNVQRGGCEMFHEKLRALRGKRTKQEVADKIGVTLSAYVKYERGERVPRDEIKRKIAALYKTTVDSIFFS